MGNLPIRQRSMRNILLVGNQHLSRSILDALSARTNPEYNIILVTYPNQTPYLPPGVKASRISHKTTNFSSPSLESLFRGQDVVISTISPGDFELQKRIVDACIASNVRGFIPLEFGLDTLDAHIRACLPAYQTRYEVVQYLKKIQNNIQWVGLCTGSILDHELLNSTLGFDLKWHSASIPGSPSTPLPISSLRRVGEIIVAALTYWNEIKNSYIYVHSCTTTAEQILVCLEKEMDVKWVVDWTEAEDARRSAERMLEAGWPDAGWSLMGRSVVFGGTGAGGRKRVSNSDAASKLMLKEERAENIIHGAVHEWMHSEKGDCGCG